MRLVRLVAALGLLGAVAVLLAHVAPGDWPSSAADVPRWLGAAPVEARVVSFVTLAAWACLGWLAFVLVAVAVGAFPRGAIRDAAERVLGVAAIGVATGALVAGPAAADGPFDRPARPARAPAASATATPSARPDPLPPAPRTSALSPPSQRAAPSTAPTPGGRPRASPVTPPPPPANDVRVVTGDTLWTIAERRLGAAATPALTAATWPRWYAANRTRIGPDPNLILPGQRLVPP